MTYSGIKQLLVLTAILLFYSVGYAGSDQGIDPNQDSVPAQSDGFGWLSKHLNVYATIKGERIDPGSLAQSGVSLTQHFEKTGHPWYYKMSIVLTNLSGEQIPVSSADSLFFSIVPGFDQMISGVSGSGSSTVMPAEPITQSDGQVRTYLDEPSKAGFVSYSKEKITWTGFHDRYFALIVLPKELGKQEVNLPFTRTYLKLKEIYPEGSMPEYNLMVLSSKFPGTFLASGQNTLWEFFVFAGPKSQDALTSGPADLKALLFTGLWGWMRWICFGLLDLLKGIHFLIPNWGWAIIFLALIVRILLYPLAKKAMNSQQQFINAQKLMLPELSEIKKNFKGGEQSERILQLYKKHNVSPFAGLKPLFVVLIQLPILIALYHVLGSAYELRDAGFLWIDTLAEPDRLFSFGFNIPYLGSYFNILPVLMAVFTLLSFKLAPAPTAEKKEQGVQNLFLIAMTLMFFFLFYSFPAGMVLYWTFANVFHIVQYRIMVRKQEA